MNKCYLLKGQSQKRFPLKCINSCTFVHCIERKIPKLKTYDYLGCLQNVITLLFMTFEGTFKLKYVR